jgi:hypothetical protein
MRLISIGETEMISNGDSQHHISDLSLHMNQKSFPLCPPFSTQTENRLVEAETSPELIDTSIKAGEGRKGIETLCLFLLTFWDQAGSTQK